ncbi:hypothetical protein [Asticcacaulis endophyticus]|uniref:Uncharacterized protein n=1 Tax=Asticcacaulis endophyticus TaxID=1395890 RepID=A0A918QCH0_9CAUL|nr:hypothetical protein [Asticcacaulis endophyticus]GGZ41528.1 hypothetical protein GCM10011273_30210 [Asticcacaulis endophyticus]
MISVSATLIALLAAASGDDYDRDYREDLQLVCYGEAQTITAQTHSGYEWDADKHKYMPKTSIETGRNQFDTAVTISIHGDEGQIRLPKPMVPPIHSGGDGNWWPIDDLIVGHNEIRGRFALNGLNKPNIVINRRSGVITIDGMVKFSGRCDADDGHRRF